MEYHRGVTFNPYAPPEEHPQQTSAGGYSAGPVQPWSSDEVLSTSWETVKRQWPVLIFGPLIAWIIGLVPGQIVNLIAQGAGAVPGQTMMPFGRPPQIREMMAGMIAVTLLSAFVGMMVQSFFQGGLIKMWLTAARGGTPQIGDVFSGGPVYLRLLLLNLLLWLVLTGGFLLFIIPGIIFALGFSMAPYYVVDADMTPMEAMKASWRAMTGQKLAMFVYGFWAFLVLLLGLLACCIGYIPALAVVSLGHAIIFCRVSGRMALPYSPYAPPAPYGAGPMPPPGGGWGAA